GGGPAEGGQLGGQDGAAVRVAGCGRTGHAGWLGPGWPSGVEPGPQDGRDLGQWRLVEAYQPPVAATGDVAAGWGEHAAAAAAPADLGQAAGGGGRQPGGG